MWYRNKVFVVECLLRNAVFIEIIYFCLSLKCLIMRLAYLGLFSVIKASIPEESKIVISALAESMT